MEKSERLNVLSRLREHIVNETTADSGGVMQVPMSDFTKEELLIREREVLFRNTPLFMGLSSILPEPNTYWSDTSTGTPILMVRDSLGDFRAYANVCRHRGSLVVPEGRGSKERFSCPFHAWTYGIDGRLIAVNKNSQFGNVSKSELGLVQLPASELYGTLWVRPVPGEPVEVGECLDGLEDELAQWELTKYPFAGNQSIDARMNWKLGLDSYGELYHLTVLHTETAAKEVIGNVQTYDVYGQNSRMVVANKKLNLMRMLLPDMSSWPYTQITSTVYFLYPNVIMTIDASGVDVIRIFPLDNSPSSSRTVHTWYIDPNLRPHFEDGDFSYEDRLRTFRESVENEDYKMAEEVQVNAEYGIQSDIVLGRNEAALQHFHNTRRAALGRELLPMEVA